MAEVLTFDFVGHVIAPFLAKDFAGEVVRIEANVAFFDCIPEDVVIRDAVEEGAVSAVELFM